MLTWTPLIAAHAAAAAIAIPVGALALLARRGSRVHRWLGPRVHKALGYTWVVLMMAAALSSVFIRDFRLPNVAGYTPIHIFTVVTLVMVPLALWYAVRRQFDVHRRIMINVYVGAGLVAGLFTLLPDRLIGRWFWGEVLVVDAGTVQLVRGVLDATPVWVFLLLMVLLSLGAAQMRARTAGLLRVLIFPVAMLGLSAVGVISAFGVGWAAALWLAGMVLLLPVFSRLPMTRGVTWNARTQLFSLPGSILPMALILVIFSMKYAIGVRLGFNPGLAQDLGFALPVAAVYGAFSALLAARGWMFWRMTQVHSEQPAWRLPKGSADMIL